VMGFYPAPFLTRMQPSVDRILARVQTVEAPRLAAGGRR